MRGGSPRRSYGWYQPCVVVYESCCRWSRQLLQLERQQGQQLSRSQRLTGRMTCLLAVTRSPPNPAPQSQLNDSSSCLHQAVLPMYHCLWLCQSLTTAQPSAALRFHWSPAHEWVCTAVPPCATSRWGSTGGQLQAAERKASVKVRQGGSSCSCDSCRCERATR